VEPERPPYQPPPPTLAPPTGWRTPRVVEPAAPRQLPVQDHAAIDAAEEQARAVTRLLGVAAGLVLVVIGCLLCGRTLF
jgi:hypothetical protein